MKHKYQIKIDQPLPGDDKIASHKDFGRILADYHNLTQPIYRKPLYKNPKAFIGMVMIISIAFLVFWAVEEEDKEKAKQAEMAQLATEIKLAEENSFLKPPLPMLAVPIQSLKADVAKPQKVQLPNGLQVTIPANAFETEAGQPVTGEVEVAVRTVDDPAEMIGMGLPLQTPHSLIHSRLVLEVKARQRGQDLRLRPGQHLDVEMAVPANFHQPQTFFTLDTQTRSWKGGTEAGVTPQIRKENRASMHRDDGFGVVQFSDTGLVIPQKRPANDSTAEIKVLQFHMDQLGVVCLGEPIYIGEEFLTYKMRFVDENFLPLRFLALYALPKDLNTVQVFWPMNADFEFETKLRGSRMTTFVGFLPDGRIGVNRFITNAPHSMPKTPEETENGNLHLLHMEISTAPIKDLQDLTQRLAAHGGQ